MLYNYYLVQIEQELEMNPQTTLTITFYQNYPLSWFSEIWNLLKDNLIHQSQSQVWQGQTPGNKKF